MLCEFIYELLHQKYYLFPKDACGTFIFKLKKKHTEQNIVTLHILVIIAFYIFIFYLIN